MLLPLPLRRYSAGFHAAPKGQGRNQTRISQARCRPRLTRAVLGSEHYRDLRPRSHFFRKVAANMSIRPCTSLAFSTGGRSRSCSVRISMRRLLGSPLVVVGESLELARNRSVGHSLDSAEQALRYY